jgi:hypothetical protein
MPTVWPDRCALGVRHSWVLLVLDGACGVTVRTGAGARINADNIWVYRTIIILVIATGLSGIIMSWSGQLYIAAWFYLPPVFSWTVPVAFDLPIATLALASLAMKSRGRDGAAKWFTAIAILFTVLSSAANFLYVADHSGLNDYQAWTGAVGKAFAPFITLIMTEVLGALITRPKPTPRRASKKRVKKPALSPRHAPMADAVTEQEAVTS